VSRLTKHIQQRLFKLFWTLERWIVPGLKSSQHEYARIVKAHVTPSTLWLDLGCGHQLWSEWIAGQAETARQAALIVGLDPDIDSLRQNNVVRHRVAGRELPFRDGSFNLVTANMVFEHLEHPIEVLREIRRVLAPNGVCIFLTPNSLYWQTAIGRHFPQWLKNTLVRFAEHRDARDVYPTHYRINTERMVREAVAQAGFSPDLVMMLNTSATSRILLLGPFVVLELLWIRLTHLPVLRRYQSNIIGVIRRPDHKRAVSR
jgi:ubiquinone/menaquinone biosynthesis C-methylase UbiE